MSDLNARQTALVLAGLRCLQQVADQCDGDLGDLHDILDQAPAPDDQCLGEEIDALCEEINMPVAGTPTSSEVWHLFLVQGGDRTRLISAQSSSVLKAQELVETAADVEHDMGVVGALYLGPTDRDIDRDANDPIEG